MTVAGLSDADPSYRFSRALVSRTLPFAVALYEHSKNEVAARSSFRVVIPPEVTPDVEFIALRFHGTAPMVGYRNGRTFHGLWLGPGFRVYRHS